MKWGLEGCTYRDNAVEGEVNNYRLTRGHTRMAPCQFKRIRNVGPGPLLCPTEGESHAYGCITWMSPPIFHP